MDCTRTDGAARPTSSVSCALRSKVKRVGVESDANATVREEPCSSTRRAQSERSVPATGAMRGQRGRGRPPRKATPCPNQRSLAFPAAGPSSAAGRAAGAATARISVASGIRAGEKRAALRRQVSSEHSLLEPGWRPILKERFRSAGKPKADFKMLLRAAAKKLPGPCKYESSGCVEAVVPADLDKHAAVCEFRPYHCPLASKHCHWKGDLSEVEEHLLKSHPDVNQMMGPSTHLKVSNIKRPAPAEWIAVQICLGKSFIVSVQKLIRNGHPQFFGTVKVIGSKEEAERFEFKLGLCRYGYDRKAISYSSVVRTLRSGSLAIMEKDCLVFDESYLQFFSVEDTIIVNVNISVMNPV